MAVAQPELRAIFCKALERNSPEERAQYLDITCEGRLELRARIEALLEAHAEAASFLQEGSQQPETRDAPEIERPGAVIGPYKLLEQIGEGGFGVVFMAEQQAPIRRKVALKVIKPGMDTRQVVARFEAERQALAIMDHPNIARVLDGGVTALGRPFFVMELVKGVTLTDYCDEARLAPRERLELFVHVCQAVQHAHQKGIIHRDLKPSNVLVTLQDGAPVVKIIDFGIAKAVGQPLTDKTLFTGFAQMIGTPLYMSPEQAGQSSDIDTRSDIYSLGVMLYELLTGSTPFTRERFKKAAIDEIRRIIREEEPPKPSTRLSESKDALPSVSAQRQTEPARLTKLVRGELDWIVMKALEKDRNRRYETASNFAADLQRYLANEAVQACPPSAGYRLRKFLRRHKGPVLAVSITLLALAIGVVGTTWGMVNADAARTAAQKRLAQIEKNNDILRSIFVDLDPKATQTDGMLRAALGKRLDNAMQQLQGEAVGDPVAVARLQATLGRSLNSLSYAQKAIGLLLEARKTFTEELGPRHPDTLNSMNDLASCYETLARHAEAIKLHEETLAIRRAEFGNDHRDTLVTMNNLANCYAAVGRREDALKLRSETLALRQAKLGVRHPDTLMTMHNLANSYDALGQLRDALELREQTLAARRATLGSRHYDTLMTMDALGNSYDKVGRAAEALTLREEVLAGRRAQLGFDHPDTLLTMHNVAVSLYALRRHQEAKKLFDEALAALRVKLGPDHPETLSCMNGLAGCLVELDRPNDALKLFEEVLARRRAKYGREHADTLTSMNNLAVCYEVVDRKLDALKLYEEALAIQKVKVGPDHPETLVTMYNLGNSYQASGRRADALRIREETLTRMKATFGSGHSQTLACMRAVATSYLDFGRHSDALQLREELLKLAKTNLGNDHDLTLSSMDDLATSYTAFSRHTEALKLCEEGLTLRKAKLGSDHRDTLLSMYNVANSYAVTGRQADALKLRLEVLDLRRVKLGPEDRDTLASMTTVANSYHALGRHLEALKLRQETLVIQKAKLGRDHPSTLITMHNLATSLTALDRHEEARTLLEETLALRKMKLGANDRALLETMWGLAYSLTKLDRGVDAVPIIDDCLKRAGDQPVDPMMFSTLLELRLRHFEKVTDAAGCRETAQMWENLKRTDAASLYTAACYRAVAAAVLNRSEVAKGEPTSDAKQQADRAMALLQQAIEHGYKNAAHMKQDPDLDPLRSRDDFKKLLAELERKQQ